MLFYEGEMAEWFKATVLKAVSQKNLTRRFESLFLRQYIYINKFFI